MRPVTTDGGDAVAGARRFAGPGLRWHAVFPLIVLLAAVPSSSAPSDGQRAAARAVQPGAKVDPAKAFDARVRAAIRRILRDANSFHSGVISGVSGDDRNGTVRPATGAVVDDRNGTVRPATGADALLSPLLPGFYERRDYRPAWSAAGVVGEAAAVLSAAICAADRHGLNPADYHLGMIELNRLEMPPDPRDPSAPERLAELDLALSDAFLLYAAHLASGRLDPDRLEPNGAAVARSDDLPRVLERALKNGTVAWSLGCLAPRHPYYAALKEIRASLVEASRAGGWPKVPDGPDLKKGVRDRRVEAVWRRLFASSGLPGGMKRPLREFDGVLELAVSRFQRLHGLEPTGAVDGATRAALNVPVEERIRQADANLERWRWLPRDLGGRHVLVNAADFALTLVEDGGESLRMKVVAGSEAWPTPVLTAEITRVVLNPFWNTPPRVLSKELINYIKADRNYLVVNKMKLLRGFGTGETEVDPSTIDWAKFEPKDIDFRLRQDPGPANVLGRFMFLMPNRYDIFLHDTPYQEDFGKTTRTFSHGCIRVEKPLDFAGWLLRDRPEWTREALEKATATGENRGIRLRTRVPVHVIYATMWRDADGTVQVRPDVYGLDAKVSAALRSD